MRRGSADVAEMAEALGMLFRYRINSPGELATLAQELDNVHHYLLIQRYRYGDRFTYEEHIENEDVMDSSLPVMTLQPLVENALSHGINRRVDGGKITMRVESIGSRLQISVEDNGVGIAEDELHRVRKNLRERSGPIERRADSSRSTGIALRNINRRIQFYFGMQYGVDVASTQDIGTTVIVTLPQMRGKLNHETGDSLSGADCYCTAIRTESGYVSLSLRAGEILGVTGISESGASVLADVLCGKLCPASGTIYLDGVPVSYRSENEARKLGIYEITHQASVVNGMTAAENLAVLRRFSWKNLLLRRKNIAEMSKQVFEHYGIGCEPHACGSSLTNEQRLEISICRALLCGAKVLVCREAGEGLDRDELIRFAAFLHQLRDEGVSVIVFNSSVFKVLQYADRIAVMRSGMICWERLRKDMTAYGIHQRLRISSMGCLRRKGPCRVCISRCRKSV